MSALSLGKVSFAIAVTAALVVGIIGGIALSNAVVPANPQATTNNPPPEVLLQPVSTVPCSWHDAPFDGMSSEEIAKLTLMDACGKLQGTVTQIVVQVRDEHTTYHFALKPDAAYASMSNSVNQAHFDGALIIEVEIDDAAVMPRLHVNQHLEVQGPFVTDIGHGWNEIHPAKLIQTL